MECHVNVLKNRERDPEIWLRLYVGVSFFWNSMTQVQNLDIDVWIDSKPVSVGLRFPSRGDLKCPDSLSVKLIPGTHRLRAVSVEGEATLDTNFEFSEQLRFMDLSLNYYPKDSPLWSEHHQDADPGFEFIQQGKDFGWR